MKKNGVYAACLKNSVRIFVKKIYKMEGSGVSECGMREEPTNATTIHSVY
jgi:hypothetical protein